MPGFHRNRMQRTLGWLRFPSLCPRGPRSALACVPSVGKRAALCLDSRVSLLGAWCFSAALSGLALFSLHIPCIALSCRAPAEGHSCAQLAHGQPGVGSHPATQEKNSLLGFSSSTKSFDQAQGSCHAHPCVSSSV